jgi:hypothetical protein
MSRIGPVLLLSVFVGYAAGYVSPRTHMTAQGGGGGQPQSQGRGQPVDPLAPPAPNIPPVANPPLYPDPPNKPMHWRIDDLRKIHDARLEAQKANPGRGTQGGGIALPPGTPAFQGQRFRTHNISTNFRVYYENERPANLTGVMSHYDDVEQHEGVSDFYVITGGGGRMVVDGVIENREYRRAAGGNTGNTAILLPGEFDGQPIRDGTTYEVKPGDWLAIPPNVPHWQLPAPNAGMSYLLLKVNVGIYPGSIAR